MKEVSENEGDKKKNMWVKKMSARRFIKKEENCE